MSGVTGAGVADPRAQVVPKIILVALVLLVTISWIVAPKAKPLVIVYGDSLTVQSESDARSLHHGDGDRVIFRARGGTAMCDWTGPARFDLASLHPSRVVLAFTGNTASCAAAAFRSGGAAGATALYETSLRQMRSIFAEVPITLVIPPAMHNLPQGWYPFNGNAELVAMYKRVGTQLGMTINTRADDTLTPGHVFTAIRPAFPNGPLVNVRLSDGVHLTPAGELWYGAALLAS
jgi:hypothetical protein